MENTTYDAYGRVATQSDAVSSGSGIRNEYNGYGYLQAVSDLATDTVLYDVLDMDARGNVTAAAIGNGVTTTWDYEAGSGLLLNQKSLLGATTLQHLTYTWDKLGNQTSRWDHGSLVPPAGIKNIQQSFCYDKLNRLVKTYQNTLAGGCPPAVAEQDQEYDSFGNITRKGPVSYTYSTASPHRLQSTSDSVSYSYDTVGNMTADTSGRTLVYTVFDKPSSIAKSTDQIAFSYGVDRELIKRVDTGSGGTSTTYRIGNVEKVVKANGSYDMKRYIAGVALWTHHFDSNNIQTGLDQQYFYQDVLGSV
jgi:hypothetical protein